MRQSRTNQVAQRARDGGDGQPLPPGHIFGSQTGGVQTNAHLTERSSARYGQVNFVRQQVGEAVEPGVAGFQFGAEEDAAGYGPPEWGEWRGVGGRRPSTGSRFAGGADG